MNVSPEWVPPFQEAGFGCIHWSELGDIKALDTVIFQWAAANNYVIYTYDLDFGAILASTNAQFPSVVQIRSQHFFPDNPAHTQKIIGYLKEYSALLMAGSLVTIDLQKSKIRVLPLGVKR